MSDHDTADEDNGATAPVRGPCAYYRSCLQRQRRSFQSTYIVLVSSCFYICTYFWKVPVFVLPKDYLEQPVVAESTVSVQTALAISQSIGYLLAKLPAVWFMSSSFFFEHRLVCMWSAMLLSASFMGVGFFIFDPDGSICPSLVGQVISVGLAGFPASVIFGGVVSWLEGRRETEALLALLNLAVVLAGGCARAFASSLLSWGVSTGAMPLLSGMTGFVLAVPLLYLLSISPRPSRRDSEQRSKRGPMSHAQRLEFTCRYLPGIASMLLVYLAIMGIRSFRDFFAEQLFTQVLGHSPDATVYFVADLPGALLSCAGLVWLIRFDSNKLAIRYMLLVMFIGMVILLAACTLFSAGSISGMSYILATGAGIYITYLPMGSAFFDRLIGASGMTGTVIFLAYISDGCGYIGTLAVLGIKVASESLSPQSVFMSFSFATSIVSAIVIGFLAIYFHFKLVGKRRDPLSSAAGEAAPSAPADSQPYEALAMHDSEEIDQEAGDGPTPDSDSTAVVHRANALGSIQSDQCAALLVQ